MEKVAQYLEQPVEEVIRLLRNQPSVIRPRRSTVPLRIRITNLETLRLAIDRLGLWPRLGQFFGNTDAQQEILAEQGYEVDEGLFKQLESKGPNVLEDNRAESLTRLLEPGLRLAEESELLDAYLSRFARDRWVRAAVRRVCSDLNVAFERTAHDQLPTNEVLDTVMQGIRSALYSDSAASPSAEALTSVKLHARALLAGLRRVRFLDETDSGISRRRWILNAGFVVNKLLGFPS